MLGAGAGGLVAAVAVPFEPQEVQDETKDHGLYEPFIFTALQSLLLFLPSKTYTDQGYFIYFIENTKDG